MSSKLGYDIKEKYGYELNEIKICWIMYIHIC